MKATIVVDLNRDSGAIKPLNGGNMAPPISNENAGRNIRQYFKELKLPITRLHDAPLDNPGLSLVDVAMIFPLMHADANEPRNYNFRATDDYIANCYACGTQVYYRLGCSIDHSINKYTCFPPADTAKWVDVASHIIRHYNYGWANGFHYNIQYWEIWNEAEGTAGRDALHTCWNASYQSYCQFYLEAATALKQRFPEIKIGGPASCGGWGDATCCKYAHQFLDFCAAHHAPLDFYSYHAYNCAYDWFNPECRGIRKYLDDLGYGDAQIHLNEWSYLPHDGFQRINDSRSGAFEVMEAMHGMTGAAFAAACLANWQDSPLDMANFYTVSASRSAVGFGIYDAYTAKPVKPYYALKAFGELAASCPRRLATAVAEFEAPCPARECPALRSYGFEVLAAKGEHCVCVMIANYRYGEQRLRLKFANAPADKVRACEVLMLDDDRDLTPIAAKIDCDGALCIDSPSQSAVALVRMPLE